MSHRPISRQRRWQLKHVAKGLCVLCNDPLHSGTLCARHHARCNKAYKRKTSNNRMGQPRKYIIKESV